MMRGAGWPEDQVEAKVEVKEKIPIRSFPQP